MPKKPSTVRLFIPVTLETHGHLQELANRLGVKPNQAYGIAISYGARMLLRSMDLQQQLTPEQVANFLRLAGTLGAKGGTAKLKADVNNLLEATTTEQKPKRKLRPKKQLKR